MSEALPRGWVSTTLDHICAVITDGTHQTPTYVEHGVPFISTANLRPFFHGFSFAEYRRFISPREHAALTKRCKPERGDILVSKCGTIGRVKEVDVDFEFSIFVGLALLKLRPGLLAPKFAEFWLNAPQVTEQFEDLSPGSTRRTLTLKRIKGVAIPIPPLAEQRRIVTKLEGLLDRVSGCQQRLAKIPVILRRFRQSVLAAACSGRLTGDWREGHPQEKACRAIVDAIRRRRTTRTHTASQRVKLQELYARDEQADSSGLPDGWGFVTLAKLCESFDYGTSAKSQARGRVPVLRMGNIQNGTIAWGDLVYTSNAVEIKDYYLHPKTVLFNRTNSPELVGKTAIYMGERPAIFAGYLIRINHCPELDPEYLNFCLNTNHARAFCRSVKSDGVSQSNINAQKLGTFEVPFCSLSEQQEIVRRVKRLFALADQIEARFEWAHAQAEKLTASLLARAFRGELVPQDPNDEPASEVLARLRAETLVETPVKSKTRCR